MAVHIESKKIIGKDSPENTAVKKPLLEENPYDLDLKINETAAEPLNHCSSRSCACNTGSCTKTCTCACR